MTILLEITRNKNVRNQRDKLLSVHRPKNVRSADVLSTSTFNVWSSLHSIERLSKTASVGMGSLLFLFSYSSRSSSAVSSRHGSSASGMVGTSREREDVHHFAGVLPVVLCSLNCGHRSLHDHGIVHQYVDELHSWHLDCYLWALNEGGISLRVHGDVHHLVNELHLPYFDR